MKHVEVINAADAKKFVIDLNREAKVLYEEAIVEVLEDMNERVRKAIKFGELETLINLHPIQRLTDINIQAAKLAVTIFGARLSDLGYDFDPFTNHTTVMTIRWSR